MSANMDPNTRTSASSGPESGAKTVQLGTGEKHPLVGQTLGGYRIEDVLGKGGMGVVFRAVDSTLDRQVALKVLAPELSGDEQYVQRFLREAKAAAALEHDSIVHVYAAGQQQGYCWIAMQVAKGVPLSTQLRKGRKFTVTESLTIVRQVASALAVAHKAGIVHRDIKPSNIMLDGAGKAMVMDFGLSRAMVSGERITRTGTYLGTPEYSSPEQCETNDLDGRSDVYSLGVVLYELLTGRVPHVAETPLALFRKIAQERPTPVSILNKQVAAPVQAILDRMLAKDRERRYATAEEVVRDIDTVLRGGKVMAAPAPTAAKGSRTVLQAVAALAVVAAVGLAIWKWPHGANSAQPTPQPSPTPVAAKPQPAPASQGTAVVVLDFKDLHASKETSWMEIGIPELLVGKLDPLTNGEVVPRELFLQTMAEVVGHKVNAQEGKDLLSLGKGLEEVVSRLRARTIVSGSYVVNGDQVVINVNVYERKAGALSKLRTETVDGDLKRLFALVDQLATRVAGCIPRPAEVNVISAVDKAAGEAGEPARRVTRGFEAGPKGGEEGAKATPQVSDELKHDSRRSAALGVVARRTAAGYARIMDALNHRAHGLNKPAAPDSAGKSAAPAPPPAAPAMAGKAEAKERAEEMEKLQGQKQALGAAKDAEEVDLDRMRKLFSNLRLCEEQDLTQQQALRDNEEFLESLCNEASDAEVQSRYKCWCETNKAQGEKKEQGKQPAK